MITIDNQTIADPTDLELGSFWLTKAGRAASGLMNMERIAKKKQVSLQWSKIAEPDLRTVLNILDAATFHTLTYPDPQGDGGQNAITVYVGDISQNLWHTVAGIRYWDGVRIGLIER